MFPTGFVRAVKVKDLASSSRPSTRPRPRGRTDRLRTRRRGSAALDAGSMYGSPADHDELPASTASRPPGRPRSTRSIPSTGSGEPVPGDHHPAHVAAEGVPGRQVVSRAVQRGGLLDRAGLRRSGKRTACSCRPTVSVTPTGTGVHRHRHGVQQAVPGRQGRRQVAVLRVRRGGPICRRRRRRTRWSRRRRSRRAGVRHPDGSALTFSSAATSEETRLPLLGIRYQPTVDDHNVAERKPVTVLPVVVNAQPGGAAGDEAEVQVSGDDGKTWKNAAVAPIGQGYKAIFQTPKPEVRLAAGAPGRRALATSRTDHDRAYPMR